ncbi:MAG: 6-carboxytetrahydropterin synthase [Bdellovibrionales bacterium]|nr:6-carboxytetrahydropterin synthase [Bdellovibrionales bacterium]
MAFLVQLAKQRFKFSATHFTVFSKDRAECLHGHNYQVSVDFEFSDLDNKTGLAIEFQVLKDKIQKVCDQLDEKVLIPTESRFLDVKKTFTNIEVTFGEKFYSFPKQDCLLLPIANSSAESLAQWFYFQLDESFKDISVEEFSVSIEESEGQAVTFG